MPIPSISGPRQNSTYHSKGVSDEFHSRRTGARTIVLCDHSLSEGARLVYQLLDDYARASDVAWPSQETISRRLGMPIRTVQYHLAKLATAKYIQRRRRSVERGMNEYVLMRDFTPAITPAITESLPQPIAQPLPQPIAELPPPVSLLTEAREEPEVINPQTPFRPAVYAAPKVAREVQISGEEFSELEAAFDRHQKYHRMEPKNLVLQLLMDKAQRGLFNWELFRGRHKAWCVFQSHAGWQYASLTLMGWIECDYPAPPPPRIVEFQDRDQKRRDETIAFSKIIRSMSK